MIGLIGSIYMSSGNSISFTDEATTNAGDNKTYTITDAVKRYFDPNSSLVVKVNDVIVTTGFTIEYAGGVINFSASQGANPVTVTGKYFAVAEVGAFYNYKISLNRTVLDTTSFIPSGTDYGWETSSVGLKSYTASAEKFYIDSTINAQMIAGKNLVIVFYLNESTAIRYEGYGFIDKQDISVDVKELIKETLNIKGNSPLYFRD